MVLGNGCRTGRLREHDEHMYCQARYRERDGKAFLKFEMLIDREVCIV